MREQPRLLIFGTAVTCGILIALAAQVLSVRLDLDVSLAGLSLAGGGTRLKSALAWWVVGGSTFVGSFVAALLLKHAKAIPSLLHWIVVGVFVIALAAIGRAATEPSAVAG